ncbi:MAG: nitroreductase family protein [Methanotrichaceae archaeon]
MELDECISGRRSIRSYKDKAVPKEIIDKILKAGIMAPSGMNAQPWNFVVIENKDTIRELSKKLKSILLKGSWPEEYKKAFQSDKDVVFYEAPLLILISVAKREEMRNVNLLDCGLAAQNMFLAAFQEGLGSCFIGFASFLNQVPETLAEIGIPQNYELMAPLIFGYPAESPAPLPKEIKILKWIK